VASRTYPAIPIEGPTTVELTLEQRYETLINVYKFQYFAIFRHIGERWGWEVANDIADEMAAEAIPTIGAGYARKFGLPGEGAAHVAQVLSAELQAEGSDVETVHESEDSAEYKIYCTFGNALQSGRFDGVDITEGLCHRGCWGWTQKLADTLDQNLVVERTHWMGTPKEGEDSGSPNNGCEYCRYTVTTVEAPDGAAA
jgi:hypothetical protein